MARTRVAILISGSGSNLEALMSRAVEADAAFEVAVVIANRAQAYGLIRAARAGVPATVVAHADFPDRALFDAALDRALRGAGAELVCLAGFMRLLTGPFVDRWRDRLLNIHPSLLPAFPGLRVHERVIEAGMPVTGCTVHLVRTAMDTGPILGQAVVAVDPADTAERLAARVLMAEHRLYPRMLDLFATGRLRLEGERIVAGDPEAARSRLSISP